MAHDRVGPGHALHAEGQDRRHHRRQSFGHRRDRQWQAQYEDVEQATGLWRAFLTGFDIAGLAMKTQAQIRGFWASGLAEQGLALA
jgi:hypothetical protein